MSDSPTPEDKALTARPKKTKEELRTLRNWALMSYTTDRHGVTLRELYDRTPEFQAISFRTFCQWSSDDQWTEERQRVLDDWRAAIELRLAHEIVKERLQYREELKGVKEDLRAKLAADDSPPIKTYDNGVKALLATYQLLKEFDDDIVTHVLPEGFDGTLPKPVAETPQLEQESAWDEEELAVITAALTEYRRGKSKTTQPEASDG